MAFHRYNCNGFSCRAHALHLSRSDCCFQHKSFARWARMRDSWTEARLLWRGIVPVDVSCITSCRFNSSSRNLLLSSSPTQSFTKNATRYGIVDFFILFWIFISNSCSFSLGGIHLCEARRRFLEGSLHPANVLMCPHTCVTNLPKPRELHHGNCHFSSTFHNNFVH